MGCEDSTFFLLVWAEVFYFQGEFGWVGRIVAYYDAYLVLLRVVELVAVVVALAIEFEQQLGARLAYKHLNPSKHKVSGIW